MATMPEIREKNGVGDEDGRATLGKVAGVVTAYRSRAKPGVCQHGVRTRANLAT
jgi:hypothetical protein